jgi:hypothetical protein
VPPAGTLDATEPRTRRAAAARAAVVAGGIASLAVVLLGTVPTPHITSTPHAEQVVVR